jgi:phenylpropionate dioxygenase-like ring-hydroxylating dioxygenase large terminal subunit
MPLSPSDFHSQAAFDREVAQLRRCWVPVCRGDEVAEAGAQKAVAAAGAPVLITRDREGRLQALSNVCRHRAMTLVEGEARAEAIRCPYHLWTYALDGALTAAPFMEPDDVKGCDLPRYGVCEWGGWVFVDLSNAAKPLGALLAPLEADLQPARLATLAIGFRLAFQHDWNWKVLVENFGESYHHIGPHAGTLQPLWPGGRTDATPSTADWIDIRHPDHPVAGELRVFVVFPLLLLATTPSESGATWYRLNPLGPERIELEIVGLYPPDLAADPGRMERAKATLLAVHQEDMAVCDRVQAGLKSPDAVLGPLSKLEAGIARFRAWVEARQ